MAKGAPRGTPPARDGSSSVTRRLMRLRRRVLPGSILVSHVASTELGDDIAKLLFHAGLGPKANSLSAPTEAVRAQPRLGFLARGVANYRTTSAKGVRHRRRQRPGPPILAVARSSRGLPKRCEAFMLLKSVCPNRFANVRQSFPRR